MDNLTKDWLAGVLKKYENRPQDSHRWAPVESVNEDGSYQVRLNGSSVSTKCSRGCVAEPGDVVLVLITADGKCVAVSRLGGEIGGGGSDSTTAVVLYDNPAGTSDDFALADSVANYSCVDVVAQYPDGVQCATSRIFDPDGKTVDLSAAIPATNIAVSRVRLSFSGATVSQAYNSQWNEESTSGTAGALKITKVVGYTSLPNEGLPSGGSAGEDGATFIPHVDKSGNLSWTNDKGLPNPETVNIKGEPGKEGQPGKDGETPVKGEDYFTEADIQECAEAAASLIELPSFSPKVVSYANPEGPVPITSGTQIIFYVNSVGNVTLHLGTKTYKKAMTDTTACVWMSWIQTTETAGSVITTQGERKYLSVGGVLSEMTVDYDGTGSVVVITIG